MCDATGGAVSDIDASLERLAQVAERLLGARAPRDMRLRSRSLGFTLVPVSLDADDPGAASTATRVVYCAEATPAELRANVAHALARGLILRAGIAPTRENVCALAVRLQKSKVDSRTYDSP